MWTVMNARVRHLQITISKTYFCNTVTLFKIKNLNDSFFEFCMLLAAFTVHFTLFLSLSVQTTVSEQQSHSLLFTIYLYLWQELEMKATFISYQFAQMTHSGRKMKCVSTTTVQMDHCTETTLMFDSKLTSL